MEEEKNKLVQQEKSVSRQPSLMSNHLKSLLGVKSSGGSRSWVQPDSVAPREARALNEIMEEEAAAKQQTQDRIGLDSNRSSWAAKAGSTSTVVTSKSQQSPTPSIQQSKPLIDSKTNKITAPEVKNPKQISNENSFGGKKMSKEVMEWCSSQLRKLNGSEDITLLQFCMSLESAVEVREYLAQYLGSTPQVSAFRRLFLGFGNCNAVFICAGHKFRN